MAKREPAPEAVALRAWIADQGLTYSAVAERMDATEATVSAFLNGRTHSAEVRAKAAALQAGRDVTRGPMPAVKEAILAAIERLYAGGMAYKTMCKRIPMVDGEFYDLRRRHRVGGWVWYKVLAWLEREGAGLLPAPEREPEPEAAPPRPKGPEPKPAKPQVRPWAEQEVPAQRPSGRRNETPIVPHKTAEALLEALDAYTTTHQVSNRAAAAAMGLSETTLYMLRGGMQAMRQSHATAIGRWIAGPPPTRPQLGTTVRGEARRSAAGRKRTPSVPPEEAGALLEELAAAMAARKLTLVETGAQMGMGKTMLGRIKNGDQPMRQHHADAIRAWLEGVKEDIGGVAKD